MTTVVDAVNGAATLEVHGEARRQVALADRIALTKVDLVSAPLALARLRAAESAGDMVAKAEAYELLAHLDRELRESVEVHAARGGRDRGDIVASHAPLYDVY